jgi:hypothetical protein
MEFMPSRLLLGLRVANSVKGITLDTKLRSESESEEEMYSMYSMLPISVGIVPKIWKGAGRCGNVDASGRSGTVYINVSDIRAIGESEGYKRGQGQLLGTLRTAQDSREIRQNPTNNEYDHRNIEHFI